MPPRVCVVDDEPAFVRLCQQILATEGFVCDWVEDLKNAPQEVATSKPDVVVLDIRLGTEADGLQVLTELASDGASTRDIPIVICTASLDLLKTHKVLIDELGCEIVEKPFDLETFIAAIQRCVKPKEAAA